MALYEKFGEFDSAAEINRKAEELFNDNDMDGLRALACENGIPDEYVEFYMSGETEVLCDDMMAAVGKIDMEVDEMAPIGVLTDWSDYIRAQCMEDDAFSAQVRRKGKSLEGCLAKIAIYALINAKPLPAGVIKEMEAAAKEHSKELKEAGIEYRWIQYTKTGAPSAETARKIIREYYMGGAA